MTMMMPNKTLFGKVDYEVGPVLVWNGKRQAIGVATCTMENPAGGPKLKFKCGCFCLKTCILYLSNSLEWSEICSFLEQEETRDGVFISDIDSAQFRVSTIDGPEKPKTPDNQSSRPPSPRTPHKKRGTPQGHQSRKLPCKKLDFGQE